MRRRDHDLIESEVATALAAIDDTLAGRPVASDHVELGELALVLVAERPLMEPAAAQALDDRCAASRTRPRRSRPWIWAPLTAAVAGLAAVLAIVVLLQGGGGSADISAPAVTRSAGASAAAASGAVSSAAGTSAPPSAAAGGGSAGAPQALHLPANGRHVTQSAQLVLSSAPDRVDSVAQEILDVIARERGIVTSSEVTATGGPDGYAEFRLSVPTANLPATMIALSQLPYAAVASRTDSSQDVNDQYAADQRELDDARALRTSLLKQLAAAASDQQIASITARIRDAEASIARDEAALRALQNRISFSPITVQLQANAKRAAGAGFTIRGAGHDALRVLTVVAGAALIGLAALLPLALVGGLGWWLAAAVRRRRRAQAIDLA